MTFFACPGPTGIRTEALGLTRSGTGQKRTPGGGSPWADHGTMSSFGCPMLVRMSAAPSLPLSAPNRQGNSSVQSPPPQQRGVGELVEVRHLGPPVVLRERPGVPLTVCSVLAHRVQMPIGHMDRWVLIQHAREGS